MELEEMQKECDVENEKVGYLNLYDGIECEKCKNRGYSTIAKSTSIGIYKFAVKCECMAKRNMVEVMRTSGLGDMMKIYRLNNYNHNEDWQDKIYNKAVEFVNRPSNCFYIGGQVGSGKTHICTAIIGGLVKTGKTDVKYCVWDNIATLLKQTTYSDKESYYLKLAKLKDANVLYIDDFFKATPSSADIKNAFEIINYRYNLSRSNAEEQIITIISSEKTIQELLEIDEGIASRIVELSKGFVITTKKDITKNYRLKSIGE